jgi:predicted kinase
MDLDHGGYRAFARYLARRYAEHSGDEQIDRLMPFYSAYRAIVRAKVAGLRAAGLEAGEAREEARREAKAYFLQAASYELPPALILMCGLPAAGKTWDARAVARPFEAVVESSDIRRKILAGLPIHAHPPLQGYDAGLYSPEMKERVYASLLEQAEEALGRGRTVVVDATFPSVGRRGPFLELAARLGAPLVVVHPAVDEEETRRRMELRATDEHEASDADFAVWQRAREVFEPPDEVPALQRIDHASGVEPDLDLAGRVIDTLVRQVTTP